MAGASSNKALLTPLVAGTECSSPSSEEGEGMSAPLLLKLEMIYAVSTTRFPIPDLLLHPSTPRASSAAPRAPMASLRKHTQTWPHLLLVPCPPHHLMHFIVATGLATEPPPSE